VLVAGEVVPAGAFCVAMARSWRTIRESRISCRPGFPAHLFTSIDAAGPGAK